MKKIAVIAAISLFWALPGSCHNTQKSSPAPEITKLIGGGCDGCKLMYVGMPPAIADSATSAGWNEPGQQLVITGKILKPDGKRPAANVILYFWQTDNDGHYSPKPGMDPRAIRHGHIRGWVKTGVSGKYRIRTIRPAPYPDRSVPAHIHLAIREPNVDTEYYPDEINFEDDELLLPYFKQHPQEQRGGSGVARVIQKDGVQWAEHNIVLGLNIPNYPQSKAFRQESGLAINENQPSFTPFHAYGPDRGKKVCPVCKYGRYLGILYFVGANPNWQSIKTWLNFLEKESLIRGKYLKVYFVYGSTTGGTKEMKRKQLEKIGVELQIKETALTFVDSLADKKSDVYLNRINPKVENTFIVYKHSNIIDKYVDMTPSPENFRKLTDLLDENQIKPFD